MTEIQQGHPFTKSWEFPWSDGMSIDVEASSFRLFNDLVTLVEYHQSNGLLIERYVTNTVTVTAIVPACLFELGEVNYDLSVIDRAQGEIFHDAGSFTIVQAVGDPEPVPEVTSIKRWDLPPDAQPEADGLTISTRYDICLGCEFYDAAEEVCLECGCTVPTKVRGLNQTCPVGKW